jgi:hypothetical protein
MAHLSKFSGKRGAWPAWKLEARMKLKVDGPAIGSDANQFAYLYSSLDEKEKSLVATYVEAHINKEPSGSKFLEYLETIFGNPNAKEQAAAKLRSMHQTPKEAFSSFLPKFELVLAEAGGSEWPDSAKINSLKGAINAELRKILIGNLFLPKTYHEFTAALRTIDSQMASERALTKGTSHEPAETSTEETDTMEWEPARGTVGNLRARWASEEEMNRRRRKGLCFRCGKPGHMVSKCSLRPAEKPKGKGEGNPRGTNARTRDDDDEAKEDPDSENE